MIRLLLLVDPLPGQRDSVVSALSDLVLDQVYFIEGAPASAAGELAQAVARARGVTAVEESRLATGEGALALVGEIVTSGVDADGSEPMVFMVASADTVRDVVVYALEAPIVQERLRFEPGGFAEVEVRLDAPWTVNRINDGCHLDTARI